MFASAWQLAKPYWFSDDKIWAWSLSVAVIFLSVGMVYVDIRLNLWRKNLFDALQVFDAHEFYAQLGIFALLALLWVGLATYQTYLKQMLQIRWRRWLTHQYLVKWLNKKAYYRLQLEKNPIDNPDQRMADDISLFTDNTLTLSLGLFNAVMTLFSFLSILWLMSGYLVLLAIVYAIFGTWMTSKIGHRLVPLNFDQQRYEADFRFGLVRLRENTEAIALYGGEATEAGLIQSRFHPVFDNFLAIIKRTKVLGWWTYSYGQAAIVFPYLMAAPRYFAKEIQLGGLMQTANAFATVERSLSYLMNSYTSIASWQSVVQRLVSFDEQVCAAAQAVSQETYRIVIKRQGTGIEISDLALNLPGGNALLKGVSLLAMPGEAVLVTGPTGCGKSTLLRAIAGIWPYGCGEIRLETGPLMFLPQRPYMPLGTLRGVFEYPTPAKTISGNKLCEVMEKVGLGHWVSQLDIIDNWSLRLSLGEQQRLSFARVLLTQPTLLFLDEATSALDKPNAVYFYQLLRKASWRPTILSVGHADTLAAFHDLSIYLDAHQFQKQVTGEGFFTKQAITPSTSAEVGMIA